MLYEPLRMQRCNGSIFMGDKGTRPDARYHTGFLDLVGNLLHSRGEASIRQPIAEALFPTLIHLEDFKGNLAFLNGS